ncbi:hypothetical protein CPB83DRAFT_883125 [Crepidotus variabilis]|uniref:Uncharacterized protein n=1 Tax=Crepidotus variabilis TaxID=179855 RepID=A0A9P6EH08_9AGAR|nr:hypothetical protein CPB83DRAFT_883125 [Crepidotus variabilis]
MASEITDLDAKVDVFLRSLYAEVCVSCASIGIQLFMCIYGLSVLLETPKERRRGREIYVAISFGILILDSFSKLPLTSYNFDLLNKPTSADDLISLQDQLYLTWYMIGSDWATVLLFWLGDGMLVYRCYIVWTGRRLITIVPLAIYLGSLAMSLWFLRMTTGGPLDAVYKAWVSLTVAVNCTVTLLIAGRLLYMRWQQKAVLASFDSKMYLSAISILAESALPLAFAGILVTITKGAYASGAWRPWKIADNVSILLWETLAALSPQMIIFRVTMGRSWAHSSQKSTQISTLAFQPNTVDHGSAGTDFDEESVPQEKQNIATSQEIKDSTGPFASQEVSPV